jgi:hypothetical protein
MSQDQERNVMLESMLHDAVVLLAILVIVPICAVAALRAIAKTKRQRRQVQSFR